MADARALAAIVRLLSHSRRRLAKMIDRNTFYCRECDIEHTGDQRQLALITHATEEAYDDGTCEREEEGKGAEGDVGRPAPQ